VKKAVCSASEAPAVTILRPGPDDEGCALGADCHRALSDDHTVGFGGRS
jgi:hypothetical protein